MSVRPAGHGSPGTPERPPQWCASPNLASSKVGGKILFATNEWFARAENLLNPAEPISQFGTFTEHGQWMDGWESARKRIQGHDWCIIRLGVPGSIVGFEVNTAFFTGNYAPKISIQAASLTREDEPYKLQDWKSAEGLVADEEDLEQASRLKSEQWTTILPTTPLRPGYADSCKHFFACPSTQVWTHLRVNIFPDGGVARLRVHGNVQRTVEPGKLINLLAIENGGLPLAWSDVHYGHPKFLINPGRGVNMGDGWETARKPDRPDVLQVDSQGHLLQPGSEWCVLQCGVPGIAQKVEIDTLHFKGNYPESVVVEGLVAPPQKRSLEGMSERQVAQLGTWKPILQRTKLRPHERRVFQLDSQVAVTHIRLSIFPDGGVSRLRVWGQAKPDLWIKGSQL